MEIAFALVAAALFALGSVLQQKAGLDGGDRDRTGSAGLLLRMARRPVWLVGIAADALGFVFQVLALAVGRLAVVQPVLVSSVVYALPLGARLTGQRVTRLDVGAALLVTAGLVGFLTIADPTGGREDAPLRDWLIAGAALAAIVVPLVLAARRLGPAPRAATLGIATGILFSLSAALTIPVTDRLSDGILEPLADWHLYALIAVGYASMTLNQMALGTGALAPAVATSMALDPITSVVLGTTLLQETLHESAIGTAGTLAALAAALAGLVVLSRSTPLGQA
ncbi:MAG TPA: DMT family transporter [Capillimicrobium sp.]|nr:DMT family transporter [Capillimicrobium sp.]